jgi:hypothetical protein
VTFWLILVGPDAWSRIRVSRTHHIPNHIMPCDVYLLNHFQGLRVRVDQTPEAWNDGYWFTHHIEGNLRRFSSLACSTTVWCFNSSLNLGHFRRRRSKDGAQPRSGRQRVGTLQEHASLSGTPLETLYCRYRSMDDCYLQSRHDLTVSCDVGQPLIHCTIAEVRLRWCYSRCPFIIWWISFSTLPLPSGQLSPQSLI